MAFSAWLTQQEEIVNAPMPCATKIIGRMGRATSVLLPRLLSGQLQMTVACKTKWYGNGPAVYFFHWSLAMMSFRDNVIPPPGDEQEILTETGVHSSGSSILYVLPRMWSLHYALTDKQWRELRQREKHLDPNWERCCCPKQCKADSLDEKWTYDRPTHTKVFLDAAFISALSEIFSYFPSGQDKIGLGNKAALRGR